MDDLAMGCSTLMGNVRFSHGDAAIADGLAMGFLAL
jgi:hypothetical protein